MALNVVVDTSVIIAVIANEPEKEKIIRITEGYDLIAPKSVYWEVGNAFSAMLRRKRTNFDTIKKALLIFQNIPIQFLGVELQESLEIANKANIYCYDAYLIRCAQKYRASLITLDKKLFKVAKSFFIKTLEI